MKILTIGDIHGKNCWRQIVPRVAEFDKIIFIGDDVDAYDVSDDVMLQNLSDIIAFKQQYPEKVVLLLGNHDIQYIVPGTPLFRRRPHMAEAFGKLFRDNADLFQIAHFERGADKKKYLWTHAGVSKDWWEHFWSACGGEKPWVLCWGATIADWLNCEWQEKCELLFASAGSGNSTNAGPLWIRPKFLDENSLPGYTQIVGHTPQPCTTIHDSHIFVDTLDAHEAGTTTIFGHEMTI